MAKASIDHIVGGIYRISLWSPTAGLTFNQFLIDDEVPTLVHTGRYGEYEAVAAAIGEVLDPARLANIVLLHWEGDENGGMDRLMETPHVHHWDSMMVVEETTRSPARHCPTTRVRCSRKSSPTEAGSSDARYPRSRLWSTKNRSRSGRASASPPRAATGHWQTPSWTCTARGRDRTGQE